MAKTLRKRLGQVGLSLLGLLAVTFTFFIAEGWTQFGRKAEGPRLEREQRSAQWLGGHFENPEPLWNDATGMVSAMREVSPFATPAPGEVSTEQVEPSRFSTPPSSGLRVTWLGHSSTLIELDGVTLLTDPVWSDRASPYPFVGPQRWYPPLLSLEQLPKLDAVLVSHDHYDHFDMATVQKLSAKGVRFVVPLGLGAHLEYWGVPKAQITELDWWEELTLAGVRIVSTPSRHASGRWLVDQNATLWTSYSLVGPNHRIYYSGDTGLHRGLKDIGQKLGPFDLAMVEVGQYHRAWPDWHIGPEQAVTASQWVQARALLPIHWCLFTLAMHGWTEPIERVSVAAAKEGVPLYTPRPGQSIDPTLPPQNEKWWPERAWQTADEHPIRSTKVE